MLYFAGRDLGDIPHNVGAVPIRAEEFGFVEQGVAVFNCIDDAPFYLSDVHQMGLTRANAKWLGYMTPFKPTQNCRMLSVLRKNAVVHDELVPAVTEALCIQALRERFPKDLVLSQTPTEALRARVARYNDRDRDRFPGAVFFVNNLR